MQAVPGCRRSRGRAARCCGDCVGCRSRSMVRAAGTADGVHPVEVESQSAIASITKTVIAAEVMRLSEEGLPRLSDPVLRTSAVELRLRYQRGHRRRPARHDERHSDPALTTSAVEADPLREWTARRSWRPFQISAKSGDRSGYEDANYMLLGLVIEETTGTSVAAALRAHVLADPDSPRWCISPRSDRKVRLALPFLGAGSIEHHRTWRGYLATKASASSVNGSGCAASDSATLALVGISRPSAGSSSRSTLLAMTDFLEAATITIATGLACSTRPISASVLGSKRSAMADGMTAVIRRFGGPANRRDRHLGDDQPSGRSQGPWSSLSPGRLASTSKDEARNEDRPRLGQGLDTPWQESPEDGSSTPRSSIAVRVMCSPARSGHASRPGQAV